ncbi:WGxxGxxG family protein [Paenibacillus sp. 203]|uniref:WGxxGxxG family protein n=1 Tax=Paenibacillus sp. 203 TaxID=3096765 RepID=UPI00300B5E06
MLKKMKIMVVVALMISSFGAAVAFAENSQNNMGTNDNGRTQMLTTNNDDDNDNWGWLGLLGLVGLAGLKRREPENHNKR